MSTTAPSESNWANISPTEVRPLEYLVIWHLMFSSVFHETYQGQLLENYLILPVEEWIIASIQCSQPHHPFVQEILRVTVDFAFAPIFVPLKDK